ncbi:MAG: dynamin family protein [Chromatiaceae bacterium]
MPPTAEVVEQRLKDLENHLERENPILLSAVQSFRSLDRVAYDMGLLQTNQSFATQIPWWPLISVLGTFSAGKSTFINHFLGYKLQRTGNQAVDDRFTVIVYSPDATSHSLPGVSLDSDPRFPFYQVSKDIELAAAGEGKRIDAYLQLKTCPSERLRGKILIDSPGFDADAQRTGILRITDHIIDLSDLVLVVFDARHPEPGAMRDTLKHLVADTIQRADSGKFLYILNQIDTAAREDNPEDVVAAWLRALGEEGLTAGRFYTVYNPDAAVPIADDTTRQRFESKRDQDLKEIFQRMVGVETERAYRIISTLRKTAADFGERTVPLLQTAVARWRRRTLIADGVIFGLVLILFLIWSIGAGHWHGLSYEPQWLEPFKKISWGMEGLEIVLIVLLLIAHFNIRRLAAMSVLPWLRKQAAGEKLPGDVVAAFLRNTRRWRTVIAGRPAGWGSWARSRVSKVLHDCETYVQTLNERVTNPAVVPEKEPSEKSESPAAD